MTTIEQAIDAYGVQVDDHLDRQATIPVSAGLQRQGDIIVVPARMAGRPTATATTPVPREGYPAVRGESGGNTHLLLAAGSGVCYDPARAEGPDLGVLTVPAGQAAYLAHPEHAYQGIAAGSYVLRRQREQADEIRMVAD